MGSGKITQRLLQKIRSIQTIAERKSPLSSNSLKRNPKKQPPIEPSTTSIYKVPTNMRRVEPKAYDPNIISIGPYHRGLAELQAMEEIKKKFLNPLLDPIREQGGATFDTLFHAMKDLEEKARACYSETTRNLSSDEFVETLLVDGCFIIELFRDSIQPKTAHTPIFAPRWMLPILRRDMIMLENQIPWFVLSTLFELTHSSVTPNYTTHDHSLIDLALKFLNPLMPRDPKTLNQSIAVAQSSGGVEHLLGLFRSSFLPPSIILRGKQPHMIRSVKELQEAGVKLEKRENHAILDLSFTKGVLKIPPLFMEDYTGTLFRNLVAFEQCHPPCKPDFTSYLFFIDGLINSAEDVGLLHYARIIQHSLGSDGEVADLINNLCREVARDVDESYLHSLSRDLNKYCNQKGNRWRAELAHNYFSSPWTLISLISAILMLIMTFFQTFFAYASYHRECQEHKKSGLK
ncbi:hypothetical protein HHK36_017312 [Tetracentron sinense]|uniref:Uncharacterized protein n=1 Tax=Tetracentron sinense TaxID=13715 RepID=A0A834Z2Z3_TETSI|nr:hypothetical protein HHK36_017312 [Tetracentron sinense]